MFEAIGFNGEKPLAVINWSYPGEKDPSYKTYCYDENELNSVYKRFDTNGDLYNRLIPTVIKVI